MKTIGMIGGMSWESTVSYYQAINQGVKRELGGLHSAKIVLNSVDFAEIERLQHNGDWEQTATILSDAARSVEAGGADLFIICTNTMHKVADKVQQAVKIPLLHIADATGEQLVADGIKTVGLLGTRFTMEQDFYKQRLSEHFAIQTLIPEAEQRELVHRVIYDELCLGVINEQSKRVFLAIIDSLFERGATAVILGCTEIALLVGQADTSVKLYDTTAIHAQAAVNKAL
ncbi:aspartate/glutamate racemase family protein [Shewanella sp. UCD-KL12]|uniref:aspartate/glutamate racemase family protein n=1 Tax=Shewanella sp. UCD-KL12 TaxID=1917163 RepID=UPI0009711009|nr:aspartate/glutamate racemase family protein [Shewanella sp. UCD-KL12]